MLLHASAGLAYRNVDTFLLELLGFDRLHGLAVRRSPTL